MLANIFSFLCLYTSMAGPPGFYFENNAYMALYPIQRTLCPNIDIEKDIIFELYTSKNPSEPQILVLESEKSITSSFFNFSQVTVIYFHGFMEGSLHGSANVTRQAYMQRGNCNFIVVNSERLLAGPWYITSAKNTQVIGTYSAKMIDFLVEMGLNLNKVHLIGHSLGCHSAGVCGYNIESGKVARITGLDPAKPLFENVATDLRLDASDAQYVDVIHTSAGTFGMEEPLGHADFYPNGGFNQPGCEKKDLLLEEQSTSVLKLIFCHHWRSFIYFAESVIKEKSFEAVKCECWERYLQGKCHKRHTTTETTTTTTVTTPTTTTPTTTTPTTTTTKTTTTPTTTTTVAVTEAQRKAEVAYMGCGCQLDPPARGIYYLETNRSPPYSIN